jgi:acyl CoA:acetate/3-ketoacid CoA transferase beta subunit
LVVRELAEGVAFDALQAATGAKLALANDWTKLTVN